jgi:hypothetical protein
VDYHRTINLVLSRFSEAQRRWYVAPLLSGATALSIRQLTVITGMDRKTIRRGKRELAAELADVPVRGQRSAGGRRHATEKNTQTFSQ